MAASCVFVLCTMLSVKLVVVAGTGDVSIPVVDHFVVAFDLPNFARLIFGLSLAALAMTLTVEYLFSRLSITFAADWIEYTAAYFAASCVVILVSSAGLFFGALASTPSTLIITIVFITVCSFLTAIVYGLVCANGPRQFGFR